MTCAYKLLHENAKAPIYMTHDAACADLALPEDVTIPAHTAVKINLGVAFFIQYGYKIVMYPRSSLLIKKGLIQPTSIIDSDYSGQPVHAPIYNPTDSDILLKAGERVAQIECVPMYVCHSWDRSIAIRKSENGGFGSTDDVIAPVL